MISTEASPFGFGGMPVIRRTPISKLSRATGRSPCSMCSFMLCMLSFDVTYSFVCFSPYGVFLSRITDNMPSDRFTPIGSGITCFTVSFLMAIGA